MLLVRSKEGIMWARKKTFSLKACEDRSCPVPRRATVT